MKSAEPNFSLSRVRERAGVRVVARAHPHPNPLPHAGEGAKTALAVCMMALLGACASAPEVV